MVSFDIIIYFKLELIQLTLTLHNCRLNLKRYQKFIFQVFLEYENTFQWLMLLKWSYRNAQNLTCLILNHKWLFGSGLYILVPELKYIQGRQYKFMKCIQVLGLPIVTLDNK